MHSQGPVGPTLGDRLLRLFRAGQPQMAGRFLEEEFGIDTVRARLIEARAEATPEITSHHPQPGPNPTARPWGDVIARTFKLALSR